MSLFSAPSVPAAPKEDPAVTAARQRAQTQADASLTQSIQDNLRNQMQARQQRFGLVPSAASVSAGTRPAVTAGFMSPI